MPGDPGEASARNKRRDILEDLIMVPSSKWPKTNGGGGQPRGGRPSNDGNAQRASNNAPASSGPPSTNPARSDGGGGRGGAAGDCAPTGNNNNRNSGVIDGGEDFESERGCTSYADNQCACCDNGGLLVPCEGRCRRSFHLGIVYERDPGGGSDRLVEAPAATVEHCNALDMPFEIAKALVKSAEPFYCPNCAAARQACFKCGREGAEGLDVVKCIGGSCGRFYHRACLEDSKSVVGGSRSSRGREHPQLCALHWCSKCKRGSVLPQDVGELGELVQCRRCPRAYHRACFPRRIAENRVWLASYSPHGRLLPGCQVETSVLYCTDHRMVGASVELREGKVASDELIADWVVAYARKFPHLHSSQAIIRKWERREGAGAPPAPPPEEAAVQELFDAARREVSKEQLREEVRRSRPFHRRASRPVDEGLLAGLEATIQNAAQHHARQPHNAASIALVLDRKVIAEIAQRHRGVEAAMAPYRAPAAGQGPFTSFGRIFASKELLNGVVARLAPFLRDQDRVVDFSCGANEFLPLVKELAAQDELAVVCRGYDIIQPRNPADFVLKSWLDVTPGKDDLGPADNLVIGVSPPRGADAGVDVADAFVRRAAVFRPRVMALLVPTPTLIPPGYHIKIEDRNLAVGSSFAVPGSEQRVTAGGGLSVRILVRSDAEKDAFSSADVGHWHGVNQKET